MVKIKTEKNIEKEIKQETLTLKAEEPLILKNEVEENIPLKSNINLSPAVRKIVEEKKINIDEIKGTGKDGRVLKGDLLNLMGIKLL